MLMISHNSMLIAQSGPMSKSLVALSAHAVALLAMSLSLQLVKSFSINLLQIQTKKSKIKNINHKILCYQSQIAALATWTTQKRELQRRH
jgi:hypothetical protein